MIISQSLITKIFKYPQDRSVLTCKGKQYFNIKCCVFFKPITFTKHNSDETFLKDDLIHNLLYNKKLKAPGFSILYDRWNLKGKVSASVLCAFLR